MKYILKKEYPGSPKLGNIIDNLENDWIENYPEFWKLVVEKVKQPLCTTEDGVDIYLGNKSWILHKNSWYLSPAAIVHNNSNWTPNENEAHWRFSTKEKAEEYILLNKPCLSYGDVQEYLKVKDCNKVLDLVQSKIKQSV